jgi:hypothetical protein
MDLLMRVVERTPGSDLAEKAIWEVAEFYERERDTAAAAAAYGILVEQFPKSARVDEAREKMRALGEKK